MDKDIQKSFYLLFKAIAINSKPPCSFTAIYSAKKVGEFAFRMLNTCNLKQPFDSINSTEGWFLGSFIKSLATFNIPVQSRTINLPKQNRFKLHYSGFIADFNNISSEEIDRFNDEEQKTRDNSPGMRHRNKSTIRCRYSTITSENKIRESLNQIKKDATIEETFKTLKYNSATRLADNKRRNVTNLDDSDPINLKKILVFYIHGGGKLTNHKLKSILTLISFLK